MIKITNSDLGKDYILIDVDLLPPPHPDPC